MQITSETLATLKKLQGKIKIKNGNEPSLTELVEKIIKSEQFKEIEEKLIRKDNLFDINLKKDRRIL